MYIFGFAGTKLGPWSAFVRRQYHENPEGPVGLEPGVSRSYIFPLSHGEKDLQRLNER